MNVENSLRRLIQSFLFPQTCVLCDTWISNADFTPLCKDCIERLKPLSQPCCDSCGIPLPGNLLEPVAFCSHCRQHPFWLYRCRSWGLYEGDLRTLIREFKFRGGKLLAKPLGRMLEECLQRTMNDMRIDWVIPVPLHPKRLRQRGFDQALLLAKGLSHSMDVPIFRGLKRCRHTKPQFGLSRRERARNLKGAFKLSHQDLLRGTSVLLLDDVMTSGATFLEIQKLLERDSEVKQISGLTIARVPKLLTE